jgi:hypothetical protein
VPERSDFLDGDAAAADKVAAFLTRALEATGSAADQAAAVLVPGIAVARGGGVQDARRHLPQDSAASRQGRQRNDTREVRCEVIDGLLVGRHQLTRLALGVGLAACRAGAA